MNLDKHGLLGLLHHNEYYEWVTLLKCPSISTLAVGTGRLPQRSGGVHLSNSNAGVLR